MYVNMLCKYCSKYEYACKYCSYVNAAKLALYIAVRLICIWELLHTFYIYFKMLRFYFLLMMSVAKTEMAKNLLFQIMVLLF